MKTIRCKEIEFYDSQLHSINVVNLNPENNLMGYNYPDFFVCSQVFGNVIFGNMKMVLRKN